MDRFPVIFKVAISTVCLIALVFLFVFGGPLFEKEEELLPINKESENVKDSFMFKPEELLYDGKGELDLLEGVSLENYTSEEIEKMVFIRISTGENLSQKIIEYTADTEEGRVKSRRILKLRNYKGPNIKLPDDMPSVTMETSNHLKDIISADKSYKVDDGFGNDVREHVQVDIEKSMQNSSLLHCAFILENEFGDRAVAKSDVIISDVPGTITLTDTIVYLHIGDVFDPSLYIESAVDMEGRSVMEEVQWDGEPDTSRLGEYTVLYELREQTATLTVVVTK